MAKPKGSPAHNKLTTVDYSQRLVELYGASIRLADGQEYSGLWSELKHVCGTCEHTWFVQPVQTSKGASECPQCRKERLRLESLAQFKKDLQALHGRKVRLVADSYLGMNPKASFICSKGHSWDAKPSSMKHGGHGCPTCAVAMKSQALRWTKEEYQAALDKLDTGIRVVSAYQGNGVSVTHRCPAGHRFEATPKHLLAGHSCSKCFAGKVSQVAENWLDHIEDCLGYTITRATRGGEKSIVLSNGQRVYVDGFDEYTNTVYEFHGSAYHGDPLVYRPKDTSHPFDKTKTAAELFNYTQWRTEQLQSLGYTVVEMWESMWYEVQGQQRLPLRMSISATAVSLAQCTW